MSNSTSAVLASVASANTGGTPSARTVARPINRKPLPSGWTYPDQRDDGTILVNVADGRISGETPGHIAMTVGGVRMETKFSADDLLEAARNRELAALRAAGQSTEGNRSWQPEDDRQKRGMVIKFLLDHGVNTAWLRPIVTMDPSVSKDILNDLDALAAL